VKLYVCWNVKRGPWGHPCGNAHHALREAGHHPEVIKAYGLRILPGFLNRTKGRREAERLTGRNVVPVLVTDDGSVISESREIVAWAQANPARAAAPTGSPA
jgi:glutathione S-transferase